MFAAMNMHDRIRSAPLERKEFFEASFYKHHVPTERESSTKRGLNSLLRLRNLRNLRIRCVPHFRLDTYSPDGSICLSAVIWLFSSTNSTSTSANSCTRNLSPLYGISFWSGDPEETM